MSRGAIFLDRDNTIIRNDEDLGAPAGVVILEGVREALQALHDAGWPLIVITNQGGVARGKFDEDDVRAVHAQTQALLEPVPILDWLWCPFHPNGSVPAFSREHPWRKPQPGMLLEAAERHNIDLTASWMIGDHIRDVEAGNAAGCRTILLTNEADTSIATHCAENLKAALSSIFENSS